MNGYTTPPAKSPRGCQGVKPLTKKERNYQTTLRMVDHAERVVRDLTKDASPDAIAKANTQLTTAEVKKTQALKELFE